jgi:hypothetical protein
MKSIEVMGSVEAKFQARNIRPECSVLDASFLSQSLSYHVNSYCVAPISEQLIDLILLAGPCSNYPRTSTSLYYPRVRGLPFHILHENVVRIEKKLTHLV